MSEDLNLKTTLSSTADTGGAAQMAEGLGAVGTVAEVVKTQVEALMASFAALFAITELISFFKDATAEAEKCEIAMRGVDSAAGSMNVSVPELRDKVEKFSGALGELGAVARDEVIGAMSKLLTETNSYEESAARAGLAMKIHTNTSYSFADALAIVDKTARGQTRGIQQLTGTIIQAADAHEKARLGLEVLEKKFGDMKVALTDEAGSLERSRASWANFKDMVGGVALKAVSNFIENIKKMPAEMQHVEDITAAVFKAIGGYIGTVAVFIKDSFSMPFDQAAAKMKTSWSATTAGFVTDQAKADADLKALGDKRIAELNAQVTKELALHTHANAIITKAAKEEGETRLAHLDEEYAQEEKVQRLREAEDIQRKARGIAREKADFDARIAEADKEAKALEQIKKASIKVRAELDKVDYQNFVATQKAKFGLEAQVASQSLSLAADMFGGNKEIAIAEAVINTAAAAVKALANGGGWPASALMMALTIASGLAEIAIITSSSAPTLPGISGDAFQVANTGSAGFDDPANDQAAYLGGRKWAGDMIGKFSGGASSVSQGWAGGMGGSTTNNNSSSHVTHINVSGGLLNPSDRESMKQFGRKLAIAMQADSQRTIARRT
jgi:hypothetical protein